MKLLKKEFATMLVLIALALSGLFIVNAGAAVAPLNTEVDTKITLSAPAGDMGSTDILIACVGTKKCGAGSKDVNGGQNCDDDVDDED